MIIDLYNKNNIILKNNKIFLNFSISTIKTFNLHFEDVIEIVSCSIHQIHSIIEINSIFQSKDYLKIEK